MDSGFCLLCGGRQALPKCRPGLGSPLVLRPVALTRIPPHLCPAHKVFHQDEGGKDAMRCKAPGWASRTHAASLSGFTPHHGTTCRAQPVDYARLPFHLTSSSFPCGSDSSFLERPGSQSSLPAYAHVALPQDGVQPQPSQLCPANS